MMHRASDSMSDRVGPDRVKSDTVSADTRQRDGSGGRTGRHPGIPDASFPRNARLLTPAAFRCVFSGGRRISASRFQLIVLPQRQDPIDDEPATHDSEQHDNEQSGFSPSDSDRHRALPARNARLGLTVAKRFAKRAVDRNRIKRIARETFRRQRHDLAGLDLVLIARNGVAELSREQLHDALNVLWRRAAALKPEPGSVTLSLENAPVTTSRSVASS